ncbi:Fur-regulated basic protein FbpA [Priestia filamentosa]|uniref:Fur-regulated basic protein FbpA n=1 Tax=Priestia filamentosa TaxID=1402861 RepID=UPI00397816EC
MSDQVYPETELQKTLVINSLLDLGIYKKRNKHLYELTLIELEEYYDVKRHM